MTDMTLLYPDRENDLVAIAATRRSTGTGSINYAAIGAYFGKLLSGGLQTAMVKGRRGFDKVISFLVDNTEVDQAFLDTLGRQESPYWGADEWNRTIVPAGYVDRFDAAADTVTLVIGFALARIVLGKVGMGGIASFAGGQYGSYKTRAYRSEIQDALDDIAQDLDDSRQAGKLNKLQDARLDGSFDLALALASAFNNNDRTKLASIVREMKQREVDNNLDL